MADYDAPYARFTFSGFTEDGEQDPFGVWAILSPKVRTAAVEPLTWRVDVPDGVGGLEAIHARTDVLVRGQAYMARANDELEAFIERTASTSGDPLRGDGTISFGAGDPTAEDFYAEKQALRDMLTGFATLEKQQLAGDVAFGGLDLFRKKDDRDGFQDAYRRWQAFVARVKQMVSQYARVETAIAGNPIGLTRVGWAGDFETRWVPGLPALSRDVHRQTVNLALASRIALIRVVSVVTTGAAGLIVKAVALPPGGQVLLIPAARRFILDVMATLREWDAVREGEEARSKRQDAAS
jgi:hypothetical protein